MTHRTIQNVFTRETPFILALGVDTVILAEIRIPFHRKAHFNEEENISFITADFNLPAEKRARAELQIVVHQHCVFKLFNKKVHPWAFKKEDLALRRITFNTKVASKGVIGRNWEGLYWVDKPFGLGAYRLLHMDRSIVKHP